MEPKRKKSNNTLENSYKDLLNSYKQKINEIIKIENSSIFLKFSIIQKEEFLKNKKILLLDISSIEKKICNSIELQKSMDSCTNDIEFNKHLESLSKNISDITDFSTNLKIKVEKINNILNEVRR